MLSKQITYLRKNNGMSQSRLAAELNVSPSAIGMYEQGRRVPEMPMLVSLSRIFGVSLDYLILGEEFVHSPPSELHSATPHDILALSNKQVGIVMLITDLTVLGARLREIRKSRKLSQTELATAAGISGKAYADIERGTSNMRVETMLRICQALHISPDEIFVDKGDQLTAQQEKLMHQLDGFSNRDKEQVFELLNIILKFLVHNQMILPDNKAT